MLNNKIIKYFATKYKLTPEKHIYMTHSFQISYESLHSVGRIILPDRISERQGSYYKQDLINYVFEYFNTKNNNKLLTPADYSEIYLNTWQLYDIDIDKEKLSLHEYLNDKIVNKASNKRYLVEQRERKEFINGQLKLESFSKNNIDHFIDYYAYLIEVKATLDNQFREKKILGKPSDKESELYTNNRNYVAEDMAKDSESNNIFNKILKCLHA